MKNCFQKVELVCGCVPEAGKVYESVLKLEKVEKVCQKLEKVWPKVTQFFAIINWKTLHHGINPEFNLLLVYLILYICEIQMGLS